MTATGRPAAATAFLLASLVVGVPAAGRAQSIARAGARLVEAGAGSPIEGAEVLATAGGERRVARSDSLGAWQLDLPAGRWQIRVRRLGYEFRDTSVALSAGATARIDLALALQPRSLEATVVTAARREQRLKDAPATIELVSRDAIERAGASDLATVLTEQTGIELSGGIPAGAGVVMQGFDSRNVLVLVDGQPLTGRVGGNLDISRIPTSMIERIEVVKGAQSTLYGSEAMGGVINVITRAADRSAWRASLEATGGSQGRRDLSGGASGAIGSVGLVGEAGHREIELTPGRSGELGALTTRWDGLAKARWSRSSTLAFETSGLLVRERQRWQSGQLFFFADNIQSNARVGAEWSSESGARRFVPTLHLSSFDHLSRRGLSTEPPAGAGDRDVQRLAEADLVYSQRVGRDVVDVGAELRLETIDADRVNGGDRTNRSAEPFVQYTRTGDGWSVVPGVRVAMSDRWGTFLTPRVAALWRPVPALALRATAGRGFRSPDFKEQYLEFSNTTSEGSYSVVGNPDLRPERSDNLSAGVEWVGGRSSLRATAYQNWFSDFIESVPLGDPADNRYTYANVSRGITRGVEVEGGIAVGTLRLDAGGSASRAFDDATGAPLLGRPRRSANATAAYDVPWGSRLSLSGVYTGATPARRDASGATTDRPSFLRVNARVAHTLPRDVEISLGARNLFDQVPADPELWPGQAGRHVYLSIAWKGGPGRD